MSNSSIKFEYLNLKLNYWIKAGKEYYIFFLYIINLYKMRNIFNS